MVAEHLDHLHYLNDILGLDIEHLNNILTDYLLHRLYIPLYVKSLTPDDPVQVGDEYGILISFKNVPSFITGMVIENIVPV